MSGVFKDRQCGLYRPANNGEGDCGVCGFEEEDHLRHLLNGEEVANYLQTTCVGDRVVYYNTIHTVIDAGQEQGYRLAARGSLSN